MKTKSVFFGGGYHELILPHFAFGGEGEIYRSTDGFVAKIYKAGSGVDEDKKERLNKIFKFKHDFLVVPIGFVYASAEKDAPIIGIYMEEVKNPISLMNLMEKSYQVREKISAAQIENLVRRIFEAVRYLHSEGYLLIDPNESNCPIVLRDGELIPQFVDIDSVRTLNDWEDHNIAINASIRDYQATAYNPNTDWYSIACVTFQLFAGMHPYDGSVGDMKLAEKVRKNLSVYSSGVKIPNEFKEFENQIPVDLRSWYKNLFKFGRRGSPQDVFPAEPEAQETVKVEEKSSYPWFWMLLISAAVATAGVFGALYFIN